MDNNNTNKNTVKKAMFCSLLEKILVGALLILFVGFVLFALLFILMYFI